MKKILLILIIFLLFSVGYYIKKGNRKMVYKTLPWLSHVIRSAQDVDCIKNDILNKYKELIDSILLFKDVSVDELNVANLFCSTYYKIDKIMYDITLKFNYFAYYNLLGSDEVIKNKIQDTYNDLNTFILNNYMYNYDIYTILKNIGEVYLKQDIAQDERLLINKTLQKYQKNGINLSEEKKGILKNKTISLDDICLQFELNIQKNKNHIIVKESELEGLNIDQIKKLNRIDQQNFKIGVDSPTYIMVMSYCKNRDVRKKLYYEYNTRAYPENIELIKKMRELRFQISQLLGYSDYAAFDIEDSMANTVSNVQKLIADVSDVSYEKAKKEKNIITKFAKEDLFKDPNFVIEPWDTQYIYQAYENKYFNINKDFLAEYFSVKKTINKLLNIYSQFFNININFIEYEDSNWKYDDLVEVIRVSEKNGDIIGDIILDLYPREGKFSHACKATLIPGVYRDREGKALQDIPLCTIVSNFNKPNSERDGLLYFDEINTFFHEFGHALHFLFATTRYASQSGTNVYADFVEVPSQLFEHWLLEKDILFDLSEHYKTGEKLSTEIIDQILYSKFFANGLFFQRQLKLTEISLNLFLSENSSIDTILEKVDEKFISLASQSTTPYFLASFGHLASDLYGPKYYCYLWSFLYAVDFFYYIKSQNGLANSDCGERLRDKVLSKGGSLNPLVLIEDFLGREFNNKNFDSYLNRYIF